MMGGSLSQIRGKLERYSPRDLPESGVFAHAAVAMIVREEPSSGEAQILMIRRAERENDPWSGQMGFPGGHVEPCDASVKCAAIRETQEELGILLDSCAEYLGRLSEIQARARSKPIGLSIVPFVYELVQPVSFRPNCEVIETFWIPLAFFLSPSNRDAMRHPNNEDVLLACYRFGERMIWGLSLAMLEELLFDPGTGATWSA